MPNFILTTLKIFFSLTAKISPQLAAQIAWRFFCTPGIKKKPLTMAEIQLQQRAEHFFLQINEDKIVVYRWTTAAQHANKKTVLLSHGWGGHSFNFSTIILALLEHGYNVIAYDSPAHGASSGKLSNLKKNTEALLQVIQKIAPVYALIGHSFGTMANAYAFDLSQTNSIFSQLKKIILIAGPHDLRDVFRDFTRSMGLPEAVLQIFYAKVKDLIQRDMASMNIKVFLKNFTGDLLVIHDREDSVISFHNAEVIASTCHAELYATQGWGHSRILSANEVIEKIISFLN